MLGFLAQARASPSASETHELFCLLYIKKTVNGTDNAGGSTVSRWSHKLFQGMGDGGWGRAWGGWMFAYSTSKKLDETTTSR